MLVRLKDPRANESEWDFVTQNVRKCAECPPAIAGNDRCSRVGLHDTVGAAKEIREAFATCPSRSTGELEPVETQVPLRANVRFRTKNWCGVGRSASDG